MEALGFGDDNRSRRKPTRRWRADQMEPLADKLRKGDDAGSQRVLKVIINKGQVSCTVDLRQPEEASRAFERTHDTGGWSHLG